MPNSTSESEVISIDGRPVARQRKGGTSKTHDVEVISPPDLAALDPRRISELKICELAGATTPRPQRFSLWSEKADMTHVADYTSWPSLTDRSFTVRHLPSASAAYGKRLPEETPYVCAHDHGRVTGLFKREQFKGSRSSVLFPYFAQWFTDSFLRTHPTDRRRNTSNHQIDMCQIYGLAESTTNILRSHKDGKLKTYQENKDSSEFPPLLFDGGAVKSEFAELPYVKDGRYKQFDDKFGDGERRKPYYFATGLERGNSTFGYAALSTLFLREHNRICDGLRKQKSSSSWGDERLFQTARMIVILLEIKIIIEEYINHIASPRGPGRIFVFDNTYAEKQPWYRENWVALEFDLLYRWHSLVRDDLRIGRYTYGPAQFLINNEPLIKHGAGKVLRAATNQAAGKIGLFNTPDFLLRAESAAIEMSRAYRLRSYNEYREKFGLKKKTSIDSFTDSATAKELKSKTLYKNRVNDVEFLVGLYAEKPGPGKLFGELMTTMVACDAFSQALTNPLLSRNVYGKETLSEFGVQEIERTSCLQDLLARNEDAGTSEAQKKIKISMDRPS